MIQDFWRDNLHRYITTAFQEYSHKMLQINSMPDHLHLFGGFRPHQSVSEIIQHVKTESTKWINRNPFCASPFNWQSGYAAFSYSKDDVQNVIRYIQNQKAHHAKETFLQEYHRHLKYFEIEYDEKYTFKEPI
jgi:REP element-mobilizing transposase RayT